MLDLLPDLFDLHQDKLTFIPLNAKHYGGRQIFYGEVVTVACHRDNSRVKQLLAENGQGKVLVVDGGALMDHALLGDMIADSAKSNGWQGVIINGCVRDVATLATIDLGVMALGAHPLKTVKLGQGEINQVVTIAGVKIVPGSIIYADANGIAISQAPILKL